MDNSVLLTLGATGFTIAFLHAAIPTHWLPFVLTGRVQKWSRSRTLAVTALAGAGHVLFTAVLGFLVAWLGIAISDRIGAWFPRIAGGTLIAFGLFYVIRQLRGHGHGHIHLFGGHDHEHAHDEHKHGAHGGMLVDTGHGNVELSVFEDGVPPRFRLYFTGHHGNSAKLPSPGAVSIRTLRPDGTQRTFSFKASADYLESTEEIPEPHEFTLFLELGHGDHVHRHKVQFVEGHDHAHPPGHGHEHRHAHSSNGHEVAEPQRKSDWAAIAGLFLLLTFSPCEGFIPVYITGVRYGWTGFALLTAILSIGTVLGMVVFTWLTLIGLERLKISWVERYESGVLGGLLCFLGVLVVIFEH